MAPVVAQQRALNTYQRTVPVVAAYNKKVNHSVVELKLRHHRNERDTVGTHAAWSQGRHPWAPRRPVSKRRQYPLHHSEAFAENPADAAVITRSTPSRRQSMPGTRNTPSGTRSRLHRDAQPQRSRPSSRARQCARYLNPARGRRKTFSIFCSVFLIFSSLFIVLHCFHLFSLFFFFVLFSIFFIFCFVLFFHSFICFMN